MTKFMDIEFSIIHCAECDTPFAITKNLDQKLRKCHNSFYCPKGHSQYFPQKSDEEILTEKLKQASRSIESLKKQEAERVAKEEARLEKRRQARRKNK